MRRYHDRGAERLAALVRVLPRRDQLLGPQRQRVDDAGQRLDRTLSLRLERASAALDRVGHKLRPAMLADRLGVARDRLDRTGRLLGTLHPNRPLEKGYAWVEGRGTGKVLATAEAARAAGALTLHFADGTVDAQVGDSAAPPPEPGKVERKRRAAYVAPKAEQPTLL